MNNIATAYLSLGSNLGNRYQHLLDALEKLRNEVGTVSLISEIYENPPSGFEAEQDFLNLCIEVYTPLSPMELITLLKNIEKEMGREEIRSTVYSSRPIDIDIILYNDIVLSNRKLTIPHPHFRERMFVLRPLNDIAPEKIDPETNCTIAELYHKCVDQSVLSVYKPKGN